MEVDGVARSADVVKTGTKRTHSGELAGSLNYSSSSATSSPHPPTTPTTTITTTTATQDGNWLWLIAKVFNVTFSVSFRAWGSKEWLVA